MAKTYSEKLKDPRWQKKRLQILERDMFRCQACGNDQETLHVHHVIPNYKVPWETDSIDLITLCESCHDIWHKLEKVKYEFCRIGEITQLFGEIEIQSVNYWSVKNGDAQMFRDPEFIYRKQISDE